MCVISNPKVTATAQHVASGPLSKNIRVYLHDSDPQVDSHRFSISRDDAAYRLAKGYVVYLSPDAVQLKPPIGWTPDQTHTVAGGLFQSAWAPRLSDHYLVWQMRPQTDENCGID